MTTQKHLFPQEVQLAIFQQLLAYEMLLKERCIMDIYRSSTGMIWLYVYPTENPGQVHRSRIDTLPITTAKELDEAVTRWWQSVPAEYKK